MDILPLSLPSADEGLSARPGRILVVDDSPMARKSMARALDVWGHTVVFAADAAEALGRLDDSIDLVLLDLALPGVHGLEVARRIRLEKQFETPIVMVTGHGGAAERLGAVEAGVNDFIQKPFDLTELRVRTEAQLRLRRWMRLARGGIEAAEAERDRLRRDVVELSHLLGVVQKRSFDAQAQGLRSLLGAAVANRRTSVERADRLSRFAGLFGRVLRRPSVEIELLRYAMPLHDLGMLAVPDAVFFKPGALDDHERRLVRNHPLAGAAILGDSDQPHIAMARRVVLGHHERWDGSGYPHGLVGDEIPAEGRMSALVCVYEALTSARPHRGALAPDEVEAVVRRESGGHFDPALAELFLEHLPAFEAARLDAETAVERSLWADLHYLTPPAENPP